MHAVRSLAKHTPAGMNLLSKLKKTNRNQERRLVFFYPGFLFFYKYSYT
jgi:hypothetical protein